MKIAFVVDAQSPIATNWMSYVIGRGHEVHILSTQAGDLPASCAGAASYASFPLSASTAVRAQQPTQSSPALAGLRSGLVSSIRDSRMSQAAALGLATLSAARASRAAPAVRQALDAIAPDIVHALRIPCEGILAAQAVRGQPLIVSTWGNDLTLFARYHPWLGRLTRQTLHRADALFSDCRRDGELALRWGFSPAKPRAVVPGAGGVQASIFHPGPRDLSLMAELRLDEAARVVINPRGFRGYVRNDTFFQAIPLVLQRYPQAVFLCATMAGNATAERWVRKLGIEAAVRLLPRVPRDRMADFFRLSELTVSPATHDGTPNTLLEAMACGCFPVAGHIDSVAEWIEQGRNGLLFDPADPQALAAAVIRALDDPALREQARAVNLALIAERAEYDRMMGQAEAFYTRVLDTVQPAARSSHG